MVCGSFQARKNRPYDSTMVRAPVAATTQADVRSFLSLDIACISWRTVLRHIGLASLPYSLPIHLRRLRLRRKQSDNAKLYVGPVQHRTCPNTGATDKDAISADIGPTNEGAPYCGQHALYMSIFSKTNFMRDE
jgi:hypothetical protein